MLSEAFPIYSGGLGNVAGDQFKSASDLGVPVVGVGLLYQRGYFRQVIGNDGEQQALYPYNDPGQLPITPWERTLAGNDGDVAAGDSPHIGCTALAATHHRPESPVGHAGETIGSIN